MISMVTSLGNVILPIAFAFGILGRRLARDLLDRDVSEADSLTV